MHSLKGMQPQDSSNCLLRRLKLPRRTTVLLHGRLKTHTPMPMQIFTTAHSTGLNSKDTTTRSLFNRLQTLQALVCFNLDAIGTKTGRKCTPTSYGSTRPLASQMDTLAMSTESPLTPPRHAIEEDLEVMEVILALPLNCQTVIQTAGNTQKQSQVDGGKALAGGSLILIRPCQQILTMKTSHRQLTRRVLLTFLTLIPIDQTLKRYKIPLCWAMLIGHSHGTHHSKLVVP